MILCYIFRRVLLDTSGVVIKQSKPKNWKIEQDYCKKERLQCENPIA